MSTEKRAFREQPNQLRVQIGPGPLVGWILRMPWKCKDNGNELLTVDGARGEP